VSKQPTKVQSTTKSTSSKQTKSNNLGAAISKKILKAGINQQTTESSSNNGTKKTQVSKLMDRNPSSIPGSPGIET
jgi:hypothetical protein